MRKLRSALHKQNDKKAHMNIAKYTIAAAAIFGVGLFLGCLITAKSLELASPSTAEKPFGAATYPVPVMPPLPDLPTPKLSHAAK